MANMSTGMARPGGSSYNRDKVERITIRRRTWFENVLVGAKALSAIAFSRSTFWAFNERGNTSLAGGIDYTERAGDGRNNSIVISGLDLLSNTFAQSPLVVKQIVGDQENIVPTHEMVQRLQRPNDFYGAELLWKATIIDYVFGNAYWLKIRSGAGKPVQFFWVPSSLIHPEWPKDDPTVFISHYEYSPNGKPQDIPVQDVVHFRNGMDPKNVRKGLSPLGAMLREIATDEEAAEFTHTILRNLGVMGMVISPSTDKGKISEPDARKIKASVMMRTTGDKRGEPLVIGGSVKVDQMGVDISKLDLSSLRHIPEERLTALLGTPAVLLGLGTGLQNATFSNVDGLRRIFYENKIIPLQTFISSDLKAQLLDDFEENTSNFVVGFNNKDVRVLKEDEDKQVDRLLKELETGGMTVNEYRALRGREPYKDDMYMLSSRIIPVAVADIVKKATVQDAPAQVQGDTSTGNNGSGNGGSGNSGSGNDSGTTGSGKAAGTDIQTKVIGDSIDRIRVRMVSHCAADVYGYLTAQRDEVVRQIAEDSKAARGAKLRINWPRVQEDFEALKGVLDPWYKRALTAVHDVVQDVLDTRYELTGTDERTYLKSAALNIKGINEYTRTQVASAVATSVTLDESADELTERIMGLDVFSAQRAHMIAVTELAAATNLAQIESYKASEVVVGILVTDGDQDAVCKAVNGLRVKMSEARSIPPLGHPNCVRRFNHILDASELESSEAA